MLPIVATLITQGLGILGNAVMTKGKEYVEEKLGVDIETELGTPEGLLTLKQLEVDHEQFLLELALEDKRIDVDNTKSARDSNARIQESANASFLSKNTAYFIDFVIVGATMLMAFLLFDKAIPAENREIAYAAFGSLVTMCGTVLNFHRGTSSGSVAKNVMLERAMK